jgi:hypothetical protein
MDKPILVLDFDGVIHSYASGWQGADTIPDPPVDGAMEFLFNAVNHFRVAIFSSRSNKRGGRKAMQKWLDKHLRNYFGAHLTVADDIFCQIEWTTEKPPAMITIDDRALTFTGEWPDMKTLVNFRPWNKK